MLQMMNHIFTQKTVFDQLASHRFTLR